NRSVFALTSLFEPFGLAPLEAAAAGLALVVTQNGGIIESLREGDREYGVLVNPDDPADIARGLERLLCHEGEWERFAQSAKQRVLSKYTWESTAKGYLSLIEQVLSSPRTNLGRDLLPIHSYFQNPQPANDISLAELSQLYFRNCQT
ncbi:MAG TPA: glycosyltransferase family 1 protein, partial [Cyanobacteria bacterium UBA9273]|nr:glycosyltransferase family 1 protein [Cyanobacteria bacterium UBA9273]